jgi:hypothetical protein
VGQAENQDMTDAMRSFIAVQNIINFKTKLQKETHPDRRRILLQLLENEVAEHPEAEQHAQAIMTRPA